MKSFYLFEDSEMKRVMGILSKVQTRILSTLKDKITNKILVPENIVFESSCGDGDRLGLVFDTDRRVYTKYNKLMILGNESQFNLKHGDLELVKVDNPKPGNWYFVNNFDNPDFSTKHLYHKYIDSGWYYYISNDADILRRNCEWENYWQVKRVEK